MEQNSSNLFELQIENQSISYSDRTAKWAKFLAIVGFIFCALIALMGIFIGTIMSKYSDAAGLPSNAFNQGYGIGMTLFYIIIAIIAVFPYVFLLRFANAIKLLYEATTSPT